MDIRRPVLFYDGECRFCRATARAIATLDRRRRFAYLPFQDPLADQMLAPVRPEERERSIHLVFADGSVVSAGDVLAELTRVLPAGRLLADAARDHRSVRDVFRFGYDLVATRRGPLSALVPDVRGPVRRPGPA
ncbi:MAG TPA: DCC1-like thiol-disulfide oxidoreductase family protein [Dehalococcoidia bacterium]|nr:DCC1-like thiol-disulfide oxidoreductase family protein [Dehalococcoidia bacterium]